MIDHIYIHKSSKTDLAAFFFARFDLIHSIQLETILRSILRQLIDRDTMSEDLLSSLEEVRTSPSFSSRRFQQLILEIIRPQQTLFMILDGLDACSQVDQRELYKVLACLSSARPSIKVFLTSHLAAPSTLIASFSVAEEISTSHPASQIDMRYIVSEAVQTALDDEVLLVRDKSLIDDIKETLTTHANGM